MATRFTFFLAQGLTVSATLDSPGQSSQSAGTSNTGLNTQAVIQAIYEALIEDDVKDAALPQSMSQVNSFIIITNINIIINILNIYRH